MICIPRGSYPLPWGQNPWVPGSLRACRVWKVKGLYYFSMKALYWIRLWIKVVKKRTKIIINILSAVLLNLKFCLLFLYTVDLNPANVAIGGVILLIFAVFAIIANIMIIAIYSRKNMRSPINTLLTGKYHMIFLSEHGPWGHDTLGA